MVKKPVTIKVELYGDNLRVVQPGTTLNCAGCSVRTYTFGTAMELDLPLTWVYQNADRQTTKPAEFFRPVFFVDSLSSSRCFQWCELGQPAATLRFGFKAFISYEQDVIISTVLFWYMKRNLRSYQDQFFMFFTVNIRLIKFIIAC